MLAAGWLDDDTAGAAALDAARRLASPERGLDRRLVVALEEQPAPDLARSTGAGRRATPRRPRGRPTARAGLRGCRAGRRRAGTPGGPPGRGSGARRSRSRPSRAGRRRAGGGARRASRRTPLRRGCVRALDGEVEGQRDDRRIEERHARLDRGLHRVLVLAVEQVGEIGREVAQQRRLQLPRRPGVVRVGGARALAHRFGVGGRRRRPWRQERRPGGAARRASAQPAHSPRPPRRRSASARARTSSSALAQRARTPAARRGTRLGVQEVVAGEQLVGPLAGQQHLDAVAVRQRRDHRHRDRALVHQRELVVPHRLARARRATPARPSAPCAARPRARRRRAAPTAPRRLRAGRSTAAL